MLKLNVFLYFAHTQHPVSPFQPVHTCTLHAREKGYIAIHSKVVSDNERARFLYLYKVSKLLAFVCSTLISYCFDRPHYRLRHVVNVSTALTTLYQCVR